MRACQRFNIFLKYHKGIISGSKLYKLYRVWPCLIGGSILFIIMSICFFEPLVLCALRLLSIKEDSSFIISSLVVIYNCLGITFYDWRSILFIIAIFFMKFLVLCAIIRQFCHIFLHVFQTIMHASIYLSPQYNSQ